MTKIDKILDYIIEIKEDVGGINQHLKGINGRLGKHDLALTEVKNRLVVVETTITKAWAVWGTITVIISAVGVFIGQWIQKLTGK